MSDVDVLGEELFVGVVIVESVGARVERRVVEVVAGANEGVGAAVHRVDDRVGEGVVVLRVGVRVTPAAAADAPSLNRRVNQSSGNKSGTFQNDPKQRPNSRVYRWVSYGPIYRLKTHKNSLKFRIE